MLPKKLDQPIEKNYSLKHLKSLTSEDRRLRFGSVVNDETIEQYVDKMWDQDGAWFGIYDSKNPTKIVALCHVAILNGEGELGLSVLPKYRNKKIGNKLFDRGVMFLVSRNIKKVFMHCLSENAAMRHMAQKAGMTVVTQYGETDARAIIDIPYNPMQGVTELFAQNLAIYDNTFRLATGAFSSYIEKMWQYIPKPKLKKVNHD